MDLSKYLWYNEGTLLRVLRASALDIRKAAMAAIGEEVHVLRLSPIMWLNAHAVAQRLRDAAGTEPERYPVPKNEDDVFRLLDAIYWHGWTIGQFGIQETKEALVEASALLATLVIGAIRDDRPVVVRPPQSVHREVWRHYEVRPADQGYFLVRTEQEGEKTSMIEYSETELSALTLDQQVEVWQKFLLDLSLIHGALGS